MSKGALNRYETIRGLVMSSGHVAVKDLAREMDVSEATVRRDLRTLARDQKIELVHGGATAPRNTDQSLIARANRNTEAKMAIGRLAGALVSDHQMLFVDAGTTCYEMRHDLFRRRGLTVIVNSTRLAIELGNNSDAGVIVLSGQYRPDRMDLVGPLAVNSIDQLRGYVAFLGADGLDPEFGIFASEIQTAHLYQHVIRNARETVLLADHTKFASPSLYRIGDIDSITKVVTDRAPSDEWMAFFAAKDIDLIYPESSESAA
jgi:DeoR/GlpR family transcriptional regulator of sugar metabolism